MTRIFALVLVTLFFACPAQAAPVVTPGVALEAWDKCVGESTLDYVQMFGAISLDDDKMDKAIEDCWDDEYAYSQAINAAQPDLSDGDVDDLVAKHRDAFRNKWYSVYASRHEP